MMAESATDTVALEAPSTHARQEAPAELGRFVVLHRIGTGGMGIVYAAYDPELDRKVAVKLLHPGLRGSDKESLGTARLLREAQAMARLSHPNVVPVFDVGTYGEQVFIAMEFVQGVSLTEWLRTPRTWREVVAVLLAAGHGLAAAHREGIVHGDFKPDNVLVEPDGRARVLDFGLAFAQDRGERPDRSGADLRASHSTRSSLSRSSVSLGTRLTRTGALTGTPPYVSPEQYLGESASARTDQYAFCVSLHEALYGARPFHGKDLATLRQSVLLASVPPEPRDHRLPGWLRRLLLRGLSRDPAGRFPSMEALLAELARDPGRRRRRIALAVTGAALLTAAALTYRWLLIRAYDREQSRCAGAADNLVGVWDAPRREQIAEALRATGLAYADDARERVTARLDDYAAAWVHMHTDACQATHQRGEQSATLLDRRMACLQRAHTELRTLVDVLAGADATVVEHAAEASAGLPPLARCADTSALLAERPPPPPALAAEILAVREQLARARAHQRTSQPKAGLALVVPALTRARALADRPLLAEAQLLHGELLELAGDPSAAEAALTDAFFTAEASRSDALAAHAAIELVGGTMQLSTPGAHQWARHARAQIDRVQEDSADEARRLESHLLNALGTLHVHEGAHAEAETTFARALELHALVPDADPLQRAGLHNNLGNVRLRRGDLAGAEGALGRASEVYRAELGPRHPSVGIALSNLGEVQMRRGEYAVARQTYTQAHEILLAGLGPLHPHVGIVLNNLGDALQGQGQHLAAAEHYTRALAIFTASFGADASPLAYPLTGLGESLLAQNHPTEARAHLERALALRDAGSPTDLARTRLALARALWPDPAARPRARDLATQAAEALRAAGEPHARELAAAETWLAAHPD